MQGQCAGKMAERQTGMTRIFQGAYELVGHTPLVELTQMKKAYGISARLLGKLEYLNPAGSVKDRVAREMLAAAEKRGILHAGAVVIEPTSGNTGIGLAALAAARGYRVIIVMPDTMSAERRNIIRAYGAELVLSDGAKGMNGAIELARKLAAEIPDSFIAGQFDNPANSAAHYKTTGPEIWEDAEGDVDAFAAGVGTGGTITGVGQYLKERKPQIQVIAAEPAASPILSGGVGGAHAIQGIGAGFIPKILDTEIYDEVIMVEDEEAYAYARALAREEGLLVGISSGAALAAAITWAKRPANEGKTVAVLLPDGGDRYYSTPLFGEA